MKKNFLMALAAVFFAAPVAAADAREIWRRAADNIGDNFWRSHFHKDALPYYLGAGAAALLLIHTGADAGIQRWAAGHDNDTSYALSAPGMVGGAAVPLLVPGMMMLSGDAHKQRAGAAALQAGAIALFSSTMLKALTNRNSPEDGQKASNAESRDFNFGFVRQNVWEGFPSGHTATNMAMSMALAGCYPDNQAVKAAAYGWAGYVALAAAIGDSGGYHWASDVVVGSTLGYVIGKTVGESCAAGAETASRMSVAPDLENNRIELIIRF